MAVSHRRVRALLVVGYALDAADGQLARLRGGGSVAGEWLDHVVDAVKIAIAPPRRRWSSGTVHGDRDDARLLSPSRFQVVASVMFFTIILNDQLRRAHRGGTRRCSSPATGSSSIALLARRGRPPTTACCAWCSRCCSGATGFTRLYARLLVANAAFLVLALVKWFREMRTY